MCDKNDALIKELYNKIHELEIELKSAKRASEALDAAQFDIWENNLLTGETFGTNKNLFTSLGYKEDELPHNLEATFEKIHPDDLKASLSLIDAHVKGLTSHYNSEMRIRAKDGRWVWTGSSGKVLERDNLGNVRRILGVSFNIDDRRIKEETMKTMAYTDELTKLGNRRMLWETGSHEVNRSLRYDHPLAMLLIDLDNFKTVNDTFGHMVGDQVLNKFAQYLEKEIRQIDIKIRFGGDEFVIMLIETDAIEADDIARRLCASVSRFDFGIDIPITVSIGGTNILPGDTINTMIERSDTALYRAKAQGRNCAIFL